LTFASTYRLRRYFFSITNYGIGGLLRKYGEGASLVRREWKPRSDSAPGEGNEADSDDDDDDEHDMSVEYAPQLPSKTISRDPPPHVPPPQPASSTATTASPQLRTTSKATATRTEPEDVDALAASMGSLSLVPPSVRFGRGAHGGFNAQARGTGRGRGRGRDRGRGKGGGKSSGEVDKVDEHREREKEREHKETIAFVPKQVRLRVKEAGMST
jgi:hypothetical protein